MLMASFEAEMKRKMASDKQSHHTIHGERDRNGSKLSFDISASLNKTRKRASSPRDNGLKSADAMVRGASTPDHVGEDTPLVKMEPEDGRDFKLSVMMHSVINDVKGLRNLICYSTIFNMAF